MLTHLVALDRRPAVVFTSVFVLVALLFAGFGTALAVKPEDKFKGDIIISEKRFPSGFKSDSHFIQHMKKVKTNKLSAEGEDAWKFEYMAFLPKPVSTLKAAVTYYDVTESGQKKLINTFAFYPNDREDKVLAGHAELSAEKFQANRKYLMEFSRGFGQKPLAKTQFVLRRKGGPKKDDGVVDFTKGEDKKKKDAKKKDDEEDDK